MQEYPPLTHDERLAAVDLIQRGIEDLRYAMETEPDSDYTDEDHETAEALIAAGDSAAAKLAIDD